jgi:hypothetical protein
MKRKRSKVGNYEKPKEENKKKLEIFLNKIQNGRLGTRSIK